MKGYLLDTNILSEVYRGERGSARVRSWYQRSRAPERFSSVLVLGEMRRGIELIRLRDPAAAQSLERRRREIEIDYAGRILPITAEIGDLWGRLSLQAPLPAVDGLLAATALHHGLTLVTRNTRDMARSGAKCFDPFVG